MNRKSAPATIEAAVETTTEVELGYAKEDAAVDVPEAEPVAHARSRLLEPATGATSPYIKSAGRQRHRSSLQNEDNYHRSYIFPGPASDREMPTSYLRGLGALSGLIWPGLLSSRRTVERSPRVMGPGGGKFRAQETSDESGVE